MSAAALKESARPSRIQFVADRMKAFVGFASSELKLEHFKKFASTCEEVAHKKSRELTAHYVGDEAALTSHAAHMRQVSAYVVLLKGGLIPALEIDGENLELKARTASAMAYLKAEFEAMDAFLA